MAYVPRELPIPEEATRVLTEWLAEEFRAVAVGTSPADLVQLPELHNPPQRPRDGMIVLADGIDWEPVAGQGRGFYGFHGGVWNKLG